MFCFPAPYVAASGGSITFTNTANPAVSTANLATHTFSSQSLGSNGSDRVIVVAVTHSTNGNLNRVSDVQLGATSGTMAIEAYGINSGVEHGGASIWHFTGITDTSRNVVVTLDGASGNNRGVAVSVFNLLGANSTVYHTGSDFQSNGTGTALDLDLNTAANGALIAATGVIGSSPTNISFTGVTERNEENNSSYRGAQAGNATISASTPLTVQSSVTGSGFGHGGVSASWQPA